LIVVDEVQRIWRPMPSGSALPEAISRLETHRHTGLDFWLVSQGPHLFHSNIRLLVGRHIHLVANWRGRSEYEFPECRQNVASRSDAVVRPYKLPRRVFGLYKSSSLHTKLDKRPPLAVFILVLAILATLLMAGRTYFRITHQLEAPGAVGTAAPAAGTAAVPSPHPPLAKAPADNPEKPGFPDFEPQIPGVPESAPAYAGLVKVKAVPLLAGCVYNNSKDLCTCYTAQATPYPASKAYCLETVRNHRFNLYYERVSPATDGKAGEGGQGPAAPPPANRPAQPVAENHLDG
jgi:zona occludens toxin